MHFKKKDQLRSVRLMLLRNWDWKGYRWLPWIRNLNMCLLREIVSLWFLPVLVPLKAQGKLP